jgi:ParB/RepB/Spo0J family partition protein
MKLPDGKSRLDLVKAGLTGSWTRKGRMVVSLDRLIEDPKNERKTYRNMEGLIASVRSMGVIEPITVTPEGDGFRILTGHRRARAARAAGVHEVEIIVREPEDEVARRRKSVVSNVQREDVGPIEMAEALHSMLIEDPEVGSQAELARILGKSEDWVSGMLRVLTLPAELQERVGSTQLSVAYDAMIRIARLEDREMQEELVASVLSGAPVSEIRRRIRERKEQQTATERIVERFGLFTASVQGPSGRGSNEKMQAAVEALLAKLRLNNS